VPTAAIENPFMVTVLFKTEKTSLSKFGIFISAQPPLARKNLFWSPASGAGTKPDFPDKFDVAPVKTLTASLIIVDKEVFSHRSVVSL